MNSTLALDVRPVLRTGFARGVVAWSNGARIGYALDKAAARLVLDYTRSGQAMRDEIALTSTPCNYGGRRWWAKCPGCGARMALLYLGIAGFRCRRCYGLAYPVTRETKADRLARRALRYRRRLKGTDNLFAFFPWKPPRMWWRTYDRIAREGQAADLAALDATLARLEWLVPWRAGRPRPTPSPSSAR